jgi:nucleolar protein 53
VRNDYQKTRKLLKVDEILAQRSVIPAVDSRKRPSSRVTDGLTQQSNKRHKTWVSGKELQRLKQSLNENNHLSSERLENGQDVTIDLWSGNTPTKNDDGFAYLEQHRSKVAPATISHAPIPMTASGKPVKAVKTPSAGTSYNPSFTDWDHLLNQEGQKVVEAEKKRLQIEQLDAERAARVAAAIASEDAAGVLTDDESAWEGFESEYERPGLLNKKRPERKTQAQRNKIKRRKEAEGQALHLAKMAGRRKQARELEQLGRNADPEEAGRAGQMVVTETGNSSSDEADDSILRRKRLRNVSIPDKSLDVVLPDELQESLRRLKPEGNLLNDRFRHLLVNGKIEVRRAVLQPKKKRVTYTEKWTHKDFQIPV